MKLVILDRDGTVGSLMAGPQAPSTAWEPLPGALAAIAQLSHAGWHVVLVSSESGLGGGIYEMARLNDLQARIHKLLAAEGGRIDAMFFCPHGVDEACRCRKPAPGLLEQIGERYGVELALVPLVGDSLDDMLCAVGAGCTPHLVLTGDAAQFRGQPLPASFPPGVVVHDDLAAFVRCLLAADAAAGAASPS